MKTNKFVNRSGFTLVELLVVIAIIASVASISIPIGTRLINSARATEGQGQMKQTIEAFRMFKEDHNSATYGVELLLGRSAAFTTGDDDPGRNGNLRSANGHDNLYRSVDGNPSNSSGAFTKTKKKYFKTATAKDLTTANVRGGVTRNGANEAIGLIDPWGRAYFSSVDTDLDGLIRTAAGPLGGLNKRGVELGNDVYFLISRGPDGIWDTTDDIMSHPVNVN